MLRINLLLPSHRNPFLFLIYRRRLLDRAGTVRTLIYRRRLLDWAGGVAPVVMLIVVAPVLISLILIFSPIWLSLLGLDWLLRHSMLRPVYRWYRRRTWRIGNPLQMGAREWRYYIPIVDLSRMEEGLVGVRERDGEIIYLNIYAVY